MSKKLKTFTINYSAEVFYSVEVAVDETLDPLNNWEDREYVERMVEDDDLERYAMESRSCIDKFSIEWTPTEGESRPEVVISKDEDLKKQLIWYDDYLRDNNEEESQLTMKLFDFNKEGGEEVVHQ